VTANRISRSDGSYWQGAAAVAHFAFDRRLWTVRRGGPLRWLLAHRLLDVELVIANGTGYRVESGDEVPQNCALPDGIHFTGNPGSTCYVSVRPWCLRVGRSHELREFITLFGGAVATWPP
jgi:hypothetical protein